MRIQRFKKHDEAGPRDSEAVHVGREKNKPAGLEDRAEGRRYLTLDPPVDLRRPNPQSPLANVLEYLGKLPLRAREPESTTA